MPLPRVPGNNPYQDATSRAIEDLENRLPAHNPVYVSDDYRAKANDLVVVDTSGGSVNIYLPPITPTTIGVPIHICNLTEDNDVEVIAGADQAIGNDNETITVPNGSVSIIARNRTHWVITNTDNASTAVSISGSTTPIWEWDGLTLDQFDSLSTGSAVTNALASMQPAYGLNWIQLSHNSSASDSHTAGVVLPISTSELELTTSNYRIEADLYHVSGSNYPRWGLVARFDPTAGSTTPGTGTVSRHGVDGWRRCYQMAASSWSQLHNASPSNPFNFGAADYTQVDNLALSVEGSTLVSYRIYDWTEKFVSASPATTGQAGLYWEHGNAGGGAVRFRNIKIWAV